MAQRVVGVSRSLLGEYSIDFILSDLMGEVQTQTIEMTVTFSWGRMPLTVAPRVKFSN
jgi:hypothetical protein